MRELAELAFTSGGWWIWINVYGFTFTITHYPDNGPETVWLDPSYVRFKKLIENKAELGNFIRNYCPDAPLDDDSILDDLKKAVLDVINR